MKKPSDLSPPIPADDDPDWADQRRRVIGLGERSFHKSYYPELRRRVDDLGQAHKALQDQIEFIRQLIDTIPNPVFFKDAKGRYLGCNRAFEAYIGISRERIVGAGVADVAPPDLALIYEEADRKMLAGDHLQVYEAKVRFADGTLRDVLFNKAVFFTRDGTPAGIVGVMQDITPLKSTQAQLDHLAHHDPLTGLPNRVLLADRLQQAMILSERRHNLVAVVYIDLDGFKAINDAYGHTTGDRLLVELAGRMNDSLRDGDTLARLGGDEFVAVLLDLENREAITPIVDRLMLTAGASVEIERLDLRVSASLGITFFPQAEDITADQLMRQADQAMYQAKQGGKNCYRIFDHEYDRMLRSRHERIERLRDALESGRFVLYYQPKVNMRSGAVVGAEALIRWQHPEHGILPPAKFLPLIENDDLIVSIGDWSIEAALRQMEDWRSVGLDVPISVNVAGRQLQSSGFLEKIKIALALHPAVAQRLELEVLESAALGDIDEVSRVMTACRDLGVSFALDDFGTGYSSLTYLKRLPVQTLKIDQSFVRNMLADPDDLAILEGIIGLAESFRRRTIAEGVETAAHGEILLRLGCELGQGFAFARPMPADQIPGWMATRTPRT